MTKKTKIVISGFIVFAIVCALALPIFRTLSHDSEPQPASLAHAKEAGIALRLYAEDHQGKLPATFTELIPKYLSDAKFFEHMTLVTPDATLEALPERSVILQYSPPERKDALIVVRSDFSGEIIHQCRLTATERRLTRMKGVK